MANTGVPDKAHQAAGSRFFGRRYLKIRTLLLPMKHFTIFLFSCLLPVACNQTETPPPATSFYYWKTVFKLTETEREALAQNHVSKLYVRYFDVALNNNQPVPLSSITFQESPGVMTIVPVIYVRNEVMLLPKLNTEDLARKVVAYIEQVNTRNSIQTNEIQVDCDWTTASKETCFRFLEQVKHYSGKTLSATIRLHQIKYPGTTGIPPVDKGVLMYYNMGHIAADASNSVYERKTARRYINSLNAYPVPLDVALPVFSWGIHIRNNTVIGLLNKVDESTFAGDEHFEMKASPFFEVKENVIKIGHFFQQGDRVKIESVTATDLTEMTGDLADALNQKPAGVIFYDLDDLNLKHYHEKTLFQKISSSF